MTTIDPSFSISGADFRIGSVEGAGASPDGASAASGGGFGQMLGDAIGSLTKTQTDAAAGARSLADGTANDPTAVVMSVERAQLAMQLASQVRNKVVEAATDIFHTQV
jgi:flagellar hook-basal body complex protein FliE